MNDTSDNRTVFNAGGSVLQPAPIQVDIDAVRRQKAKQIVDCLCMNGAEQQRITWDQAMAMEGLN